MNVMSWIKNFVLKCGIAVYHKLPPYKNDERDESVPIGCPQRIEFNAHRVFSPKYLLKQFNGKYRIDFLSYVDGAGDLHKNVDINDFKESYKDNYGCGIFELTKL